MEAAVLAAIIAAAGNLASKLLEKWDPAFDGDPTQRKLDKLVAKHYQELRADLTNDCVRILLRAEGGHNSTSDELLTSVYTDLPSGGRLARRTLGREFSYRLRFLETLGLLKRVQDEHFITRFGASFIREARSRRDYYNLLFRRGQDVLRPADEPVEEGQPDDQSCTGLYKALVSSLQDMLQREDFRTVLRVGAPLSRALWLEGEYRTRVAVGQAVEEAAARLSDTAAQAQALIDDIGWTLVVLGNEARAEQNIKRGLELAESSGMHYYAAKAHRHLAGLAAQRGLAKGALEQLKEAERLSEAIEDRNLKEEMIAGLRFGEAQALLLAGDLDPATEKCLEARELFAKVKDEPRRVKTFALSGAIAEKAGRALEAKDAYRRGLELSKNLTRADEIIRNQLGLARIAQAENEWDAAKTYVNEAKARLEMTPIAFMNDDLTLQLSKIERRQNDAPGDD